MHIENDLIPDEHDIVHYLESQDPMVVAFGMYMSTERRGVSEKEIAEKAGVSEDALKYRIHKKHSGSPPWRKIRDEMHLRRAKDMIKPALPELSSSFVKSVKALNMCNDLLNGCLEEMIKEKANGEEIDPKVIIDIAKGLVSNAEKMIKIKRLEVGEAVSHIEIHSKQINQMTDAEAEIILNTQGIPDIEQSY